ncbi:hypothetical protein K8375_11710 [Weissella cibaria]|nr:hypothetical protein [Weissella cibaria]MBZ6070704.1 hypothetical protein [Weissella cibaria]
MKKQTGKGIGLVIGMLIIIGVLIGAYVLGKISERITRHTKQVLPVR